MMQNRIFKARTKGIGAYTLDEAIEWGVTGPDLRACGFEWDLRKKRPYSGYEQFEFDIPTGQHGDCYDRARGARRGDAAEPAHHRAVRRTTCRTGPYKSDHPLATPPLKDRTMHDIETLITHFLSVSWGPVMPPGEALGAIEATKGNNGYYLVSDGSTMSYRTRIRTPSFPHMQMLPLLCRGLMIPDLLAILGSHGFRAGGRRPMRRRSNADATEEINEIEAELAHYPKREAVCIDALKIVQRHRGWVSDESVRDIAGLLDMSPDGPGRRRHLLQPDLPQAGRPPRDHDLRQRQLLDHGLRPHARAPARSAWASSSARRPPTAASRCCRSSAWARCDHAPAMMVDDDLHSDLDPQKIDRAFWRSIK